MSAASGRTRNELRVSRSAPFEDHQHAQLLVRAKAMVCAGFDEHGRAFRYRKRLPLDLEHPVPFHDDVDLVVFVRLLAVGSGATSTYTPSSRPGDWWTIS